MVRGVAAPHDAATAARVAAATARAGLGRATLETTCSTSRRPRRRAARAARRARARLPRRRARRRCARAGWPADRRGSRRSSCRPTASSTSGEATYAIDRVVEPGGSSRRLDRERATRAGAPPSTPTSGPRTRPTRAHLAAANDIAAAGALAAETGSDAMTERCSTHDPAVLVLEDGTRYVGPRLRRPRAHPRRGRLRDRDDRLPGDPDRPVVRGQIVLQTAPHIGNTGMNDEDTESRRIWVSGYIVRDPSRVVSNWRADEPRRRRSSATASSASAASTPARSPATSARRAACARGVFSGDAAALADGEQLRARARRRPRWRA